MSDRVETMRRLHAEILSEAKGSQERRVLEHKLAEFIRGSRVEDVVAAVDAFEFDAKAAAAGDGE